MTESLDVDVLGLRVRIELGDDLDKAQREQARLVWSGALASGERDADLVVHFAAGSGFDRAMERLTVDVTLAALAALRGRALMFHAAGVADEDGRVAAFVGPSGRGKTTLSRELGRRWGYVSDETVAVDPGLRVHAYRKPLSVVRDGAPKRQVSPEEASLRNLPNASLRLASLVLIDRDAQLDEPRVSQITLASALPELVPQMSYLRDQYRPLQSIAALSDAVGGIRLLRYPDATTVPPLLPLLMAPGERQEWHPAPAASTSGPYSTEGIADAILTDGFVVVMAGSTVHVLDGIAPAVWLACAQGKGIDGIVSAVIAEHGLPPEGEASVLVEQTIGELIAAGVLQRR